MLCIGNYFRAKRAQERQRQRRLAKLATYPNQSSQGGGGPSHHQHDAGSYEAPSHITPGGDGGHGVHA